MVPKSVLFVHTETTWGNISKGTKVTYPGFDYSTQTRMYLILDECHEETEDRAPAAANEGTKRKAMERMNPTTQKQSKQSKQHPKK